MSEINWNNIQGLILCRVANTFSLEYKNDLMLYKGNSSCSFWAVAYQGGGLGGFNPPPPEIPKALQNHAKLNTNWKLLKIAEFRTPTPQYVRKEDSKILKPPRFAVVLH